MLEAEALLKCSSTLSQRKAATLAQVNLVHATIATIAFLWHRGSPEAGLRGRG